MKVAVLIDGGICAFWRGARNTSTMPTSSKRWLMLALRPTNLLRALYYDCAPFIGKVKKPVSGDVHEFTGSDGWLRELAERDLIAVRRGVPKFRGFKPKRIPISSEELTDDDFRPDFEQKGVDMRIGLDIANFANQRSVDRIILVTNDTDCIPAMKNRWIAGLQIVLAEFDNQHLAPELLWHSDIKRRVA